MKKYLENLKTKIKKIIYTIFFEKKIDNDFYKKQTYNQIIQWISLYDKDPLKIVCSDKLKVKKYIEEKLNSDQFTPKTFIVAEDTVNLIKEIKQSPNHPKKYLIKANNDSGNIIKIDKNIPLLKDIKSIENYKYRSYGIEKGEWFYSGIEYKCFTEEYLGDNISDYKVHCINGEPQFCQIISDRGIGKPKEVVVDRKCEILNFHLDTNFKYDKKFKKPQNWDIMMEISRKLSSGFKLVRVDLYNLDIECDNEKSIYVGELTFSPRTGRYKGSGQIEAGKLISDLI